LLDSDGAEKLACFLAFKSRKHVNFVATLTGAVLCAAEWIVYDST
jgi:hypothetical protein